MNDEDRQYPNIGTDKLLTNVYKNRGWLQIFFFSMCKKKKKKKKKKKLQLAHFLTVGREI